MNLKNPKMNENYSFISDLEPSEAQLEALMQAVSDDVKVRATAADEAFFAAQERDRQLVFQIWQQKQQQNGKH
jgi:hypothetical protein